MDMEIEQTGQTYNQRADDKLANGWRNPAFHREAEDECSIDISKCETISDTTDTTIKTSDATTRKSSGIFYDAGATATPSSVPYEDQDSAAAANLLYSVEDVPPWYLCIFLALQHSLTSLGANLAVALIVSPAMCVTNPKNISEILGTTFFVGGIVTFLQSTFGIRLPIVQGSTFSFIIPVFAILNLPQWRCPTISTTSTSYISDTNNSENLNVTTGPESPDENLWMSRMREIQGAIILASLFEVIIGFTGLIGVLLKFVGPLTIASIITLIGLSLFTTAAEFSSKNWYIAIMTSFLIILFSQYLRKIEIPCCFFDKKRKCSKFGLPLFSLFPVILAMILSWLLCVILTVTNAIPNDKTNWSYYARTDVKIGILIEASWFRFPYPFQWGLPTFSTAAVFGMLAGVLSGVLESVGDYFACARLAGASPPPMHAVNRGIFIEGFGCVLAGMWGTGTGTTSYSENVGAIGITKVGSRRVIQVEGIVMILVGMLNKFDALLVTIPDPVIGGVFLVMFGMICAVGISNLQFVDLNSSRNLCVFGFSVVFSLALPSWLNANKDVISTGNSTVDQIVTVLLSTSMFVGGALGLLLDNTIPGSRKERGLDKWREKTIQTSDKNIKDHPVRDSCYDLPFGMNSINRLRCCRYIPLSPTFFLDESNCEPRKASRSSCVDKDIENSTVF